MPEVSRTRATFRSAEFGFLGVIVYTRVQTPRRCEEPFSAGLFVRFLGLERPFRTSCWIVGMAFPSALFPFHTPRCRGPRVISPEPLGRSSKAAIPREVWLRPEPGRPNPSPCLGATRKATGREHEMSTEPGGPKRRPARPDPEPTPRRRGT